MEFFYQQKCFQNHCKPALVSRMIRLKISLPFDISCINQTASSLQKKTTQKRRQNQIDFFSVFWWSVSDDVRTNARSWTFTGWKGRKYTNHNIRSQALNRKTENSSHNISSQIHLVSSQSCSTSRRSPLNPRTATFHPAEK